MLVINPTTKMICLTRGDIANILVSAKLQDKTTYTFQRGDVVRFAVFKRNDCATVVLQKDFTVSEPADKVMVSLTKEDTTIGGIINKPFDYWYEIELNPETEPQTIIGYDIDGEKIFRLYPEGSVSL